jgi:hypothetical protein
MAMASLEQVIVHGLRKSPLVMKTSECRRLKLSCPQQLSSRRTYDGRRTRNSWRHILRRLLR